MSVDGGGLGEKVKLVLVDQKTGLIKKYYVVIGGVWIDLAEFLPKHINAEKKKQLVEKLLSLAKRKLRDVEIVSDR